MAGDGESDLATLVGRVAAGDRSALARLYGLAGGKLLGAARRILKGAAAEDAVQEAWIRIWRRAGDFDPEIASPIAWMTTIARHAAIDAARRGAERIAAASDEIDSLVDGPAAPAANPGLETPRLRRCLEGLEPERRTMILLAYCYGWSREELAGRFDRPAATVKTILRRSLIALKECLGGER